MAAAHKLWATGWPRPEFRHILFEIWVASAADLSAAASPAYPSLRGYGRAETADGPRRRQSVIHMRAQMLRSIFLARHGSIHGRCAPVRCLPPPVFEICAFPSHKNTLEFSMGDLLLLAITCVCRLHWSARRGSWSRVIRWGVDFIPMKFLWRTELPFARGRGPVWRGAGGRVPYRLRVVPRPSGTFSGGPPVCRHQTPSNGRGRPSRG